MKAGGFRDSEGVFSFIERTQVLEVLLFQHVSIIVNRDGGSVVGGMLVTEIVRAKANRFASCEYVKSTATD